MSEKENSWSVQLDWLNILNLLSLKNMDLISEYKKDKAIRRTTKLYGTETLLEFEPSELDELVANELRDLMKKELSLKAKEEEKMEKEFRSKMIPFKRGGIIKIDPRDFKDMDPNGNPEEIMKYFYKKLLKDDDDDGDDDNNKVNEDNTGYYI